MYLRTNISICITEMHLTAILEAVLILNIYGFRKTIFGKQNPYDSYFYRTILDMR